MAIDTELTLKLLAELKAMGFPDEAFGNLHHFREKGEKAKIDRFENYIVGRKIQTFRDDENNSRVHRRLEIVRDAYQGGGFKSDPARVFVVLAEAAFLEVPPFGG